jgi:hypothetical protein
VVIGVDVDALIGIGPDQLVEQLSRLLAQVAVGSLVEQQPSRWDVSPADDTNRV